MNDTTKTEQTTRIVCHGNKYLILAQGEGRILYYDGTQFGSIYGRKLYSTYQGAELAVRAMQTVTR